MVEVEADDYDSAFEKVEEMVNCEEVVLTADDFEGREFYLVEVLISGKTFTCNLQCYAFFFGESDAEGAEDG